jgi:L-2-hydroxyglutarate oxidase LhgO
MWETTSELIRANGGQVQLNWEVIGLATEDNRVIKVVVRDTLSGKISHHRADYVFSTMPVRELITAMSACVPEPAKKVAAGRPTVIS